MQAKHLYVQKVFYKLEIGPTKQHISFILHFDKRFWSTRSVPLWCIEVSPLPANYYVLSTLLFKQTCGKESNCGLLLLFSKSLERGETVRVQVQGQRLAAADQAGPVTKDLASPRQGTSREISSFQSQMVESERAQTKERRATPRVSNTSTAHPDPPQLYIGNPHPSGSRVTNPPHPSGFPAPPTAASVSSLPVGPHRRREDGGAGRTCPAGEGWVLRLPRPRWAERLGTDGALCGPERRRGGRGADTRSASRAFVPATARGRRWPRFESSPDPLRSPRRWAQLGPDDLLTAAGTDTPWVTADAAFGFVNPKSESHTRCSGLSTFIAPPSPRAWTNSCALSPSFIHLAGTGTFPHKLPRPHFNTDAFITLTTASWALSWYFLAFAFLPVTEGDALKTIRLAWSCEDYVTRWSSS